MGRVPAKAKVGVQPVSQATGARDGIGQSRAIGPDGSFVFPDLAPGDYAVFAATEAGGPESARLIVTLAGESVDIVVTTYPSLRLAGQVETDDGAAPPLAPSGLTLVSALDSESAGGPMAGSRAPVHSDWSFDVRDLYPSRFLLRLSGLPTGWALKAVVVADRDMTDVPVAVKGPGGLTGVRLVVTNRLSEVTGTVVDDRNRPVRDYAVVLFAEDEARWTPPSRYCVAARADQDGRYVVRGLPPGEYCAAALEFLEEGRESDPELLKELRKQATRFALGEAERRALTLRLTKASGGAAS